MPTEEKKFKFGLTLVDADGKRTTLESNNPKAIAGFYANKRGKKRRKK